MKPHWVDTAQLATQVTAALGEAAVRKAVTETHQPWLEVHPDHLLAVCQWLRESPDWYFDLLECLTGVDEGPEGQIGVVYHLVSVVRGHRLVLKCMVERDSGTEATQHLPALPSLTGLWRTADWHEREAYDLVGIYFTGHPDLRRILMPEDWPGHPLRKDYQNPDFYHNVQTDY